MSEEGKMLELVCDVSQALQVLSNAYWCSDVSDQGFTRPKILILLPFRQSAYSVINLIIQLMFGDSSVSRLAIWETCCMCGHVTSHVIQCTRAMLPTKRSLCRSLPFRTRITSQGPQSQVTVKDSAAPFVTFVTENLMSLQNLIDQCLKEIPMTASELEWP